MDKSSISSCKWPTQFETLGSHYLPAAEAHSLTSPLFDRNMAFILSFSFALRISSADRGFVLKCAALETRQDASCQISVDDWRSDVLD